MRERQGWRCIPYAMEDELRALPVAQRAVLTALVFEAAWEPTEVTWRGQRIALDVGEALVSYEGLVRTLRLGTDPGVRDPVKLIRRALASGRRLGLIDVRPAVPEGGTPRGTGGGTWRGTPHGTPPRVVRFLRHRAFLWPADERGTPHGIPYGTPRGTGGGTIPVVQQPVGGLARPPTTPSPAAPPARAGGAPSPDELVERLRAAIEHHGGFGLDPLPEAKRSLASRFAGWFETCPERREHLRPGEDEVTGGLDYLAYVCAQHINRRPYPPNGARPRGVARFIADLPRLVKDKRLQPVEQAAANGAATVLALPARKPDDVPF